jgi:predicted glutamine amidotransferase
MSHSPPKKYALLLAALLGVMLILIAITSREGLPVSAPSSGPAEAEPHNCRFWGMVGSGYDPEQIETQLRTGSITSLKALGGANRDGWGFSYYPPLTETVTLQQPLVRRGGPYADHRYDPEYDLAIDELSALRPRALLASIRVFDAGQHHGVPSPHPFIHDGWAFTHSGNIYFINTFRRLFLEDEYLDTYVPDYYAAYIDSELLFMSLQRLVRESELSGIDAYLDAILNMLMVTADDRLDFAMTAGDSLLVLRYAADDTTHPIYYAPGDPMASIPGGASSYWLVATEPFGENFAWTEIPPRTLAVFTPGAAPQFHTVLDMAADSNSNRATGAAVAVPRKVHFYGLIGTGYPADLISDHLRDDDYSNLKEIGDASSESWATVAFTDSIPAGSLNRPIERRGRPPAPHPTDPDYDLAVSEMMAISPRAALGHVRLGTSGHFNLPDPHPFQHEGYSFGHNGSVSVSSIRDLLLADDPEYLDTWPPDYEDGNIDSEMYFLYLLKYKRLHPELTTAEALREAVASLGDQLGNNLLNFVMTAGDTLYALRFNDYFGVKYFPDGTADEPPDYWFAASQIMGDDSHWGTIPVRTLAVFVPNEAPAFYPIDGHLEPEFSIADVTFTSQIDADNDGWNSGFTFCCDPDVEWGVGEVIFKLYKRNHDRSAGKVELPWEEIGISTTRRIVGSAPADLCLPPFQAAPDTLSETAWEFRLELFDATDQSEAVAVATGATHAELRYLQLEGAALDTIPHSVPALTVASLRITEFIDGDEDGNASGFTVYLDPNYGTDLDRTEIFVKVITLVGGSLRTIAQSEPFTLQGDMVDEMAIDVHITPDNQRPARWDLGLELYDSETEMSLLIVTYNDFPSLALVAVEGIDFDGRLQLGAVTPNPVSGMDPALLPITVPDEGAAVSYRIWDVSGRMVRSVTDLFLRPGKQEISWDGRDGAGRPVSSGVYYCRVSSGDRSWQRRIIINR